MEQQIKSKSPHWVYERFYNDTLKKDIESNGYAIMNWNISKPTMIATLNYLRFNLKLKCEWIEKNETFFIIKISI